jgi:hypothetical protein
MPACGAIACACLATTTVQCEESSCGELFCFPRRRRRRKMLRFFVFLVAGFPFPSSFACVSFLHTPYSVPFVLFVFFFAWFSFPSSFPCVSAHSLRIILLLPLRPLLVPFCVRYAFAFFLHTTYSVSSCSSSSFLRLRLVPFVVLMRFLSTYSLLRFFARFSVPSSFAYDRERIRTTYVSFVHTPCSRFFVFLRLLPLLVPLT